MQAAAKGQLDIVEHLAGEQGAVIGAKKPDGYTALIFEVGHEALMQNKRRAPKQLLPRAKWAHDEDLCSPPLICVCSYMCHAVPCSR